VLWEAGEMGARGGPQLFVESDQGRFEFGCQPKIGCVIGGELVPNGKAILRNEIRRAVQCNGLRLIVRKRQVNRLRRPARLALFQGDADYFMIQQARGVKGLAGEGAKCFVSCGLFEEKGAENTAIHHERRARKVGRRRLSDQSLPHSGGQRVSLSARTMSTARTPSAMGLGKRLRCSLAISSTVLFPRRMESPKRSREAPGTGPVSTTAFSTSAISSPCSER
jgi:hypothetical protein